MTQQSEALNAFGGMTRAFEKPLDTHFFQILPVTFFHTALCFDLASLEDDSRRSGFPSWSWCGWNCAKGVDYKDHFLPESLVEICDHIVITSID